MICYIPNIVSRSTDFDLYINDKKLDAVEKFPVVFIIDL